MSAEKPSNGSKPVSYRMIVAGPWRSALAIMLWLAKTVARVPNSILRRLAETRRIELKRPESVKDGRPVAMPLLQAWLPRLPAKTGDAMMSSSWVRSRRGVTLEPPQSFGWN